MDQDLLNASQVGHMVPLKCGHRGKPNRSEEKLIDNILKISGFLYDPNQFLKYAPAEPVATELTALEKSA